MARKRNLKPVVTRYVADRDLNRYGESGGSREGHTVHRPSIGRQIDGAVTPDTRTSTGWAPASWSVGVVEAHDASRVAWTVQATDDTERAWDPDGRWQRTVYYSFASQSVVERTYRGDRHVDREREDYERTPKRRNVTRERDMANARWDRALKDGSKR